MFWVRRVRKELLAYQALRLRQSEVKRMLAELGHNVRLRTSEMTGMPRLKGGKPQSSVELEVVWREQKLQKMQQELKDISARLNPIKHSLKALSPLEQQVIKYTYLNYSLGEKELADRARSYQSQATRN